CFQAEDGIRDRNVTGVQTCALPISIIVLAPRDWEGGQFPSTHVTATGADRVTFDDGKLYVEAFASGEVDATLADGRVKTARIPRSEERRVGKECTSRAWLPQ